MKSLASYLVNSIATIAIGAAVPAAHADVTYQLDCTFSAVCSSASNFGFVRLQAVGSDVKVTVGLLPGEVFAGTGSGHETLTWDLNGDPSVPSVSGLNTAEFVYQNSPIAVPGFGKPSVSFDYYVDCTACQGGKPSNPSTLSFTIPNHSITDFVPTSQGFFFTSDLLDTAGKTGSVGADGAVVVTTVATPEPSYIALLGVALAFCCLISKWNRAKSVAVKD